LPDRKTIENRARQPVLWVPSTVPESVIERTRWGAEQGARTMAVATVAAAQNGASGALALCKQPVLAGMRYAVNRQCWLADSSDDRPTLSDSQIPGPPAPK
jgi:hypothetical protein